MERFLKSRYKIGEKISENPFSVTYRGSFLGTDKPLIIKIYKRGTLNSALIKQMKQKVKDFSFFNYHGIAKFIDGDYGWQGFYYVREYIPGQSLQEILDKGEKIGEDKAILIAEEILKALEFAHSRGVVHGALKPGNIIVDAKGVVRLTDFVIEGEIKEALPQKAVNVLNNAKYASPEELLGNPASFSSDIYALGLILYEMTAGKSFSAGEDFLNSLKKMRSVSVLDQTRLSPLPRYLQEIILKALQFDPLLRFASVSDFRESLEKKTLTLKALPHEEYIKIFENTVTQYGEEIEKGPISYEDLGQVKIKWGIERHRNWILAVILVFALVSGFLYAFLFVR